MHLWSNDNGTTTIFAPLLVGEEQTITTGVANATRKIAWSYSTVMNKNIQNIL